MAGDSPINNRILVIDDDQDIWQAYGQVLQGKKTAADSAIDRLSQLVGNGGEGNGHTFAVDYAAQGQEGFDKASQARESGAPYSVAFIDIRMPPGWDGLETAAKIRKLDSDIEIVIVTAYSDRSRAEIATAVGCCDKLLFIRKPFDAEELMQLAISLTAKWQLNCDLLASESRFRDLVESTSDWVWEMDKDGCFSYCSPLCAKLYGYHPEELLGQCFYKILMAPEEQAVMADFFARCLIEAKPCQAHERQYQRKDGTIIMVESSGVPIYSDTGEVIGYRGIDRDITGRKQQEEEIHFLEEQQRQAQKLGALGTLSGGIAHDMNNILTPILGFTELAMVQAKADSILHDQLQNINNCTNKAADLIRQILAFSRKQSVQTVNLSLNEVVDNFYKMLRRLIREDIELQLHLAPELGLVAADCSQMEQVLINLIVNARDAMEEQGQIILITTEQRAVAADSLYDATKQPLPAGEYVVLQVKDEGVGMTKEIQDKIFDPFYTTKDVGKGTGLGLSTVFGIIGQHNGHICLTSAPDQGSTFTIYLPSCQAAETETEQRDSVTSLARGDETILLVEDNHDVRDMLATILGQLGYTVITAINGRQGIVTFKEQDEAIALVVSDVVMPIMSGVEMAEVIRQQNPAQPLLFITGHAFANDLDELLQSPHCMRVAKPFALKDIAEAIRTLLD